MQHTTGVLERWYDQGRDASTSTNIIGGISSSAAPTIVTNTSSSNPALFFSSSNAIYQEHDIRSIWNFLHQETDSTLIVVYEKINLSGATFTFGTGGLSTSPTPSTGFHCRWATDFGETFFITENYSGAASTKIALCPDYNNKALKCVYVVRKTVRPSSDRGYAGTPTTPNVAELRVNGQVLAAQQSWANTPPTTVGNSEFKMAGGNAYVYEILIDNRWIPDDLIIQYEEYVRNKYNLQIGTENFVRTP